MVTKRLLELPSKHEMMGSRLNLQVLCQIPYRLKRLGERRYPQAVAGTNPSRP